MTESDLSVCFIQMNVPAERRLTLARTGVVPGWCKLQPPPPLRLFADSEKTAARRAAGFWGMHSQQHLKPSTSDRPGRSYTRLCRVSTTRAAMRQDFKTPRDLNQ